MIRKTLIILSLVGFLTSLGLWSISYAVLGWSNGRTIISVSGGAIRYVEFVGMSTTRTERWYGGFSSFSTALIPRLGWRRVITGQGGTLHFILPIWIPTAFFATVLWFSCRPLYVRRRRRRLGLCVNCGYNLTGTESGVCSECGNTI